MQKHPFQIVGLGEVLWDVFPDGPRFGGAPANFASTCKQLARDRADAHVFSAVGMDSLGEAALHELSKLAVRTDLIQRNERETGQVIVELDPQGRASYRFIEKPAWDEIRWFDAALEKAQQANAVCFGTLAQRSPISQNSIERFLDECPSESLKVLDLNLRAPYYTRDCILESMARANALKLNDEELPVVAELLGESGTDRELLHKLRDRFGFRFIALTKGERGSVILADRWLERTSNSIVVKDTVGAGDAFTAALVLGVLAHQPWESIQAWATDVAAYVASQSGATPPLPNELCLPQ
ncbi:PfkB family carbohydrate kinase [Pirellulaceae bacterium SH501]